MLTAVLLLATPAAVQAQFNYTVTTNQTVTINGYTGTSSIVDIPSTINGQPVISIGDYAFSGSIITGVTIPNSVTSIGVQAFSYCTSLTKIAVDPLNSDYSSVDGVLFNQSQTTLVEYPGGKVGGYTIPNSVTSIGGDAFVACTNLTSVTIPNSVTYIGVAAFEYCTSLTSVTIPNSVTSIGVDAFYICSGLTSVTIGNSVTNIGARAFNICSSLTSVTIGNSVTSIGFDAFYGCLSLTNVTLGSGVTTIGDYAFEYCSGLTGITIPNSVTSIGDGVFNDCNRLTSVYFQGNAPSVIFGGPNLFSGDPVTIYYLPGTTGWGSTFGGRPTALWTLPYPLILTSTPSFGVRTNQFGFTVSWAINLNVVVEAATDLANPIWSPVQTNTLTSGWFYFDDPQWTKYPSRFYRIRSQ